jgi:hypothetical protein
MSPVARFDRIKEEIGWLKLVFGVLVAVDVSLIAWLAQNHVYADANLVLAGFFATVILSGVIIWVARTVHRRIEELEEL